MNEQSAKRVARCIGQEVAALHGIEMPRRLRGYNPAELKEKVDKDGKAMREIAARVAERTNCDGAALAEAYKAAGLRCVVTGVRIIANTWCLSEHSFIRELRAFLDGMEAG